MATNTAPTHRIDPRSDRFAAANPAPFSHAQLVLTVACLLAALLMIVAIANVAQIQVQKGQDFRFAESTPAAPQFYANHGGLDKPDMERSDGALQRVAFTR